MHRTQRLRDPVHGLITFSKDNPIDALAWSLIDTPEFGRLRRIKQLGVSEFVYPGATHTRFIHSIGVFHIARQLIKIVEREIAAIDQEYDKDKAAVAVIAALLHDVGHGPFSHTFEGVQADRNVKKKHEEWSAEIIVAPKGHIRKLLEDHKVGFSDEVAALLRRKNPEDVYDAVVSSSFDADRLDYLRRDKMMTGTGAGAIDFDWLLEHVRVRKINLDAPDGTGGEDTDKVPTFCIDIKALPAAEQFLLARFTLHDQVYFHKTTRCVEKMIEALLMEVAEVAVNCSESEDQAEVRSKTKELTGLDFNHPIIKFFVDKAPTTADYLELDDVVLFGSLERLTHGTNLVISKLAKRLKNRRLYKTLDCRTFDQDLEWQAVGVKKIDKHLSANKFGMSVIKDDSAKLTIYTHVGGDDEKAHKKLRILEADGKTPEITKFKGIVASLPELRLTRYYFEDEVDREEAKALGRR